MRPDTRDIEGDAVIGANVFERLRQGGFPITRRRGVVGGVDHHGAHRFNAKIVDEQPTFPLHLGHACKGIHVAHHHSPGFPGTRVSATADDPPIDLPGNHITHLTHFDLDPPLTQDTWGLEPR